MLFKIFILSILPLVAFGKDVVNSNEATDAKWYSIGELHQNPKTQVAASDKDEKEEKEEESESKNESYRNNEKENECSPKGIDPWPCGNFSLPSSQQIGPLVSFGQLIIPKETLQYYLLGNAFWGSHTFHGELSPAILYGITDDFVAYLVLPFSAGSEDRFPAEVEEEGGITSGRDTSWGLNDITMQFEYAYYTYSTRCYVNQATIVSAIIYPAGNRTRRPATGFGAPSFFIGGTFSHMRQGWYCFGNIGGLYPCFANDLQAGNSYVYQFGFEKVICARRCGSIFAWMVEFDGTHFKRDLLRSQPDPDSGGDIILLTPSLWYSTRHWIFQGGLSFPIEQKLNGHQHKEHFGLFFSVGLTV